ncbi:MAG: hypothetical protein ACKVKH_13800 [Verrucomicrobiales bacterium]
MGRRNLASIPLQAESADRKHPRTSESDREHANSSSLVVAKHQEYIDKRITAMTPAQHALLGFLWKEKRRLDPDMKNRGNSFVRILEFIFENK